MPTPVYVEAFRCAQVDVCVCPRAWVWACTQWPRTGETGTDAQDRVRDFPGREGVLSRAQKVRDARPKHGTDGP